MTIKDIRPKEELPALMNNLTRVRTKHENSGIWKHRKKDGKIIEAEIISHEIIVEERKARIVSVNDVTERKRLESQLLQANKMEAIGQLASGVAHDFNNMLAGAMGYTDLSLKKLMPTIHCIKTLQTLSSFLREARVLHGNCWRFRASKFWR